MHWTNLFCDTSPAGTEEQENIHLQFADMQIYNLHQNEQEQYKENAKGSLALPDNSTIKG